MTARSLKRILLVEDDPDIQTIACMALESFGGFRVRVCGSAGEALSAVGRFRPDLILLDVMMPGVDGIEALRSLRELPATASTPVIFVTARVQPAEVARYEELGSVAVIAKPFEPTALVGTIQGIWNRYHGRAD